MTAGCHRAAIAAYCDRLDTEVGLLVDVIGRADPAAPVPTCPDWTVRVLVEHVGTVHRWAAHMVRVLAPERVRTASLDLGIPAADAELPAWLAAGRAPMLEAFGAADPDAEMWAWGSDRHARFWPRRMLHETIVHRVDAQFAAGEEPSVDAAVAVDGIDELLDNLPCAVYFAPAVAELKGDGERLSFVADDAGTVWSIQLGTDGFSWDHVAGGEALCEVRADAGDLLLLLYGRRSADDARFAITGDRAAFDHWLANSSL